MKPKSNVLRPYADGRGEKRVKNEKIKSVQRSKFKREEDARSEQVAVSRGKSFGFEF
jgi:hypothetical protein